MHGACRRIGEPRGSEQQPRQDPPRVHLPVRVEVIPGGGTGGYREAVSFFGSEDAVSSGTRQDSGRQDDMNQDELVFGDAANAPDIPRTTDSYSIVPSL